MSEEGQRLPVNGQRHPQGPMEQRREFATTPAAWKLTTGDIPTVTINVRPAALLVLAMVS